jgi:hypothetical protein
MLTRRHCPHTGIVNFFTAADPMLAIGSVIKAGEPAAYHWRHYMGRESAFGVAPDMRTAENRLISRHAAYLQTPDVDVEPQVPDRMERRAGGGLLASAGKR